MIPEGLYLQRTRYLQKHEENITFDKYIVVTMNIYYVNLQKTVVFASFFKNSIKKTFIYLSK